MSALYSSTPPTDPAQERTLRGRIRELERVLDSTIIFYQQQLARCQQFELKAKYADQMRDAAILWKKRAVKLGWVEDEPTEP
jgi:hypothetical protein